MQPGCSPALAPESSSGSDNDLVVDFFVAAEVVGRGLVVHFQLHSHERREQAPSLRTLRGARGYKGVRTQGGAPGVSRTCAGG